MNVYQEKRKKNAEKRKKERERAAKEVSEKGILKYMKKGKK